MATYVDDHCAKTNILLFCCENTLPQINERRIHQLWWQSEKDQMENESMQRDVRSGLPYQIPSQVETILFSHALILVDSGQSIVFLHQLGVGHSNVIYKGEM